MPIEKEKKCISLSVRVCVCVCVCLCVCVSVCITRVKLSKGTREKLIPPPTVDFLSIEETEKMKTTYFKEDF